VVPTHLIEQIDERALRTEAMEPFKVEVIVRGYMAGSMMRAYEKGTREFCGVTLPEGLKRYDKLQKPIITPTTKAEVYQHDEDVDPETLIKRGVCTEEEWNEICGRALDLFNFGQEIYQAKNWILVDTKYEFGKNARGEIKVIDEIHTPDSSRLWIRDSYAEALESGGEPKMLDKENVRRYLASQGFTGEGPVPSVPVQQLVELSETYLEVAERLIDRPLEAQKKYEFKL
jgi:phosphoribosylaminoimidazole-succinocarboxamide synthase